MVTSTEGTAAVASASGNDVSQLTEFPFLKLLPELQLNVYEILVTAPGAVYPRELMPVRRNTTNKGLQVAVADAFGRDATSGQPAITKVSRQVRKDSLALYYSRNHFMMHGSVIEMSSMVPLSRYPDLAFTDPLRHLKTIGCLVSIQDRCPTPASQKPARIYTIDIDISTTKNMNGIRVELAQPHIRSAARVKYLVEQAKAAIGQPKDGRYDGHYLLKAATYFFDGVVCRDRKPQWRDLDVPPPQAHSGQVPLFPPGVQNAGNPAAPGFQTAIDWAFHNWMTRMAGPGLQAAAASAGAPPSNANGQGQSHAQPGAVPASAPHPAAASIQAQSTTTTNSVSTTGTNLPAPNAANPSSINQYAPTHPGSYSMTFTTNPHLIYGNTGYVPLFNANQPHAVALGTQNQTQTAPPAPAASVATAGALAPDLFATMMGTGYNDGGDNDDDEYAPTANPWPTQ